MPALGRCRIVVPEHEERGREHHRPKQGELLRTAEEHREASAKVSAEHGNGTEGEGDPQIDVAQPAVSDHTNQAGCTYHGQTHGNGLLRLEAEHVHEDRHGED